jgi:hypothetical protein
LVFAAAPAWLIWINARDVSLGEFIGSGSCGLHCAGAGDFSMSGLHGSTHVIEQTDLGQVERRRPGRTENVNPALLPLLRGSEAPALDPDGYSENPLAPATGIMVGLLISGLIWTLIGSLLIWLV